MKLYADHRPKAVRQLAADVTVLLWVAGWVWVGRRLTELVDRLGEPGRQVATAGSRLESGLDDVAGGIGRLPVVGGSLEDVFGDAAGAGTALRRAGADQAEFAHDLAVALGVGVAGLAIVVALALHLPRRLRWARDAEVATALLATEGGLRVFALRAVANRPLGELRRASPDPGGDLAAGRFDRLAALELAELGVRPPARAPSTLG